MSSPIKPLRLAALFVAAATLSACDVGGIGEGNRLETLEIVRTTALIDRESNASYICFADKLQLVGTFTDGGQGDYSSRGRWTSSDPSIVAVSNGDILIPGSTTLAYASGTIVPKAVTTTPVIITADFVGLSASYEVVVKKIDTGAIEISTTQLKLAPETVYPMTLKATVDGYELNLTQAATWSFVDADEDTDDIAVIGASTGVIAAKLPATLPAALRARAEFPECQNDEGTAPLRFEADVVIETPTSLTLEREFAADAPLIVNTTEALKITGTFADSSTQDLTGQVKLDSSDDEVIVPGAFAPQIVSALEAGTVTVKAIYGGDDDNDAEGDTDPPLVESNTISLTAVEGTLQSFEIAPLNPTITALGNQQFTALGSFSVAGETLEQPITRHVTWVATTLDDKATAAVAVSNSAVTKGLVVSLLPSADAIKIKATYAKADPDPDLVEETALCIVKPGDAAGSCPPDDAP